MAKKAVDDTTPDAPDDEPVVLTEEPIAGPIRAPNGSFLPATYPCGDGMTRTDN